METGVVGSATLADHERAPAEYALQTEVAVVSRDVSEEDRLGISDVLLRHSVKSMVSVIIAGKKDAFSVLEVEVDGARTE